MSPLPFPALGQCSSDQLALHSFGLPAKHVLVENIIERAEISAKLEDISKDAIRKELDRLCKVNYLADLKYKQCNSFPLILEEEALCPVEREKYWILFDTRRKKIAQRQISNKETKVINLWLEESGGLKDWASQEFRTILYDLAQEYCPVVFENNGNRL